VIRTTRRASGRQADGGIANRRPDGPTLGKLITAVFLAATTAIAQPPQAPYPRTAGDLPKAPGPLSPEQERETFRLPERFTIDLIASEPDVVDPVAMCFDERGRLYVCEMRGYPNGGVGTGDETRGKIKCFIDTRGTGAFDRCVTFAEGLRFPMGITPYKNGLIVAVAPDLIYLEDTDGDGKADKKTVLYTGFNLANIQQMVNSLQWGLDNWVYGCAGSDGGTVRSVQKPEAPPVSLRNRGFRFKPDVPGSLEPTSGGGQYGLTADDYQRWFTATNSQHLRQIVLREQYLKRNPYLPVSAVTLDIPEHGAAAKVFRISPFEPWRVERTTRRAGGPDSKRFPATELVPGGFFTSACSPLIYTGQLFPRDCYGDNFVCDPANNLVHRERLAPNGAVFKAVRVYPDREFLASTDTWFRPVWLSTGPDGAMYVLDFYREVIETPLSLPEDLKKQLNLESRGRGRIWRVAPTGFKPEKQPDFSALKPPQLAEELISPNPWRRITAQRLHVEREERAAVPTIRGLLEKARGTPGRVNLLWTLHGLGALTADDVLPALRDAEAGVREIAVRLTEGFVTKSEPIRKAFAALARDTDPRVRFQVALSAGVLPGDQAAPILAEILARDAGDPWTVTAALSSAAECAIVLTEKLAGEVNPYLLPYDERKPNLQLLTRLAALVGAKGNDGEIARLLARVVSAKTAAGVDAALLAGLGQGMRNGKVSLAAWLAKPPAKAEATAQALGKKFLEASGVLEDGRAAGQDRVAAAGLLALAPLQVGWRALTGALSPDAPGDVQQAAVKALAAHTESAVADHLLANWKGYGPATRAAVLDTLLARPDRVLALLGAVEKKEVAAATLSPAQVQQLKNHPNAAVRKKAEAVFKEAIDTDRAKVVTAYKPALELKGDPKPGKAVFQKHCAACHKLDGVGHEVGPNLLATVGNKSGEDLLVAVFDPNREVDPRYLTYQVGTADERVLTGVVVAETPTSITVRQAEGTEDVILRANLSLFRATAVSLMPVGLEKELKPQDVADLFAYLRSAGK
jgi:putative membrane-bound dehydrogenase-like protein